jgi:hypothetical protein
MLTFSDQYGMAQQITGDTSAAALAAFKRDINEGGSVFLNRLGRKFNHEIKITNIVDGQQYYQMPSDVIRVSDIRVLNGTTYYVPELVTSEEMWNKMNSTTYSGNYPTHFYIRGFNEIGLWPIPSSNVTNGLTVSFEPQHVELTQADVTTGSVTVSNGSINVTHSGTSFTPQMVGRYFQVTDSTDGRWYRIGAYVSSSSIQLENYYEGISGSGRSFRIGEIMKIPQGYQDAPVFFALDRYYLTQGDKNTAAVYSLRFDQKLKSAKSTYGKSTAKSGVKKGNSGRPMSWIELTPPVSYP